MRVPLPLTILAVIALAAACGGSTPATATPGRTSTATAGATATAATSPGASATAGGGGGGTAEDISCNDGVVGSDVSIVDFAFEPAQQTADADDTVHWQNNGDQRHTVTFDNGKDCGTLEAGDSLTVLFTAPGDYKYHCTFHSTMTGTIKVG